jgi:hypothetical protein
MTKLSLIALALVFFSLPAAAEPTQAQRQACQDDAFKFCNNAMPDEQRVRQCLVRNMRRLSPTCRSAFHRSRRR